MRRFLVSLAAVFIALSAYAQDIPAGMRMECASVEEDDNVFTIFSYKDNDGTFGYYLGIGREVDLLEIFRDDDLSGVSLGHMDEVCLPMGETIAEAVVFLNSLKELREKDPGTTVVFPCRLTAGAEQLSVPGTATAVVVDRWFQAQRICFHFQSGRHSAEVDLTRSTIKSLQALFGLYRNMHPDE